LVAEGNTRAGLVALAGRPNVGKSTLVNAIVGQKVAIVSDKPQTTRRAIRGVATRGDAQLVLTDLPGVQRPLDNLTERMQRRVERELSETDVALMVLNAEQGVGPGDRWIAGVLKSAPCPVVIAVNKVDRLDRPHVVLALEAAGELGVAEEIFPVSARKGTGVGPLADYLFATVPESPFLFDPDELSDLSPYVHLAELVREQILRRTFKEVPHAVEVVVEEVDTTREDLTVVHARAWVETESQKGILVGAGGKMIRSIGTAARKELERDLGTKVHLDLIVRVRRGWRGDDALLDRLGFDV
jgi:GTPase